MTKNFFDLQNRKVWLFGGAGYLGSRICRALDDAGARVLCLDVEGRAARMVEAEGLKLARGEDFDLFAGDGVEAQLADRARVHGTPDAVVNLAMRGSHASTLEEATPEQLNATFAANQTAAIQLGRFFGPRMGDAGGGTVIFFSSMYGMVAPDPRAYHPPHLPNPVDYGTAKAGVLQIARYFAVYYGRVGVRFNCVTPGAFPAAEYREASPDTADCLRNKVPLGRFGEPDEIIGPTLFLLSPAASYVNGHSLVADGGWTIQ